MCRFMLLSGKCCLVFLLYLVAWLQRHAAWVVDAACSLDAVVTGNKVTTSELN